MARTAKNVRASESDLVSALQQRLRSVVSEINTAQQRLAELNQRRQRIQEAFELLADDSKTSGNPNPPSAPPSTYATTRARRSAGQRARRSRNPGADALLAFVQERGATRVSDVAERFTVTHVTARNWLTALTGEGKLRQSSQGRASVWQQAGNNTRSETSTAKAPAPNRRRATTKTAKTAGARPASD